MSDWRSALSPQDWDRLEKQPFPDWIDAMKATLTDDHFSSPDWIYEPKLDGERLLAFIKQGKPQLYSRNRKNLNSTYPELVEALADRVAADVVLDGEVVALKDGVSSFARLQGRLGLEDAEEARQSGVRVYLYLFDVMFCDGYDLRELPLRRRKQLLKKMLAFGGSLRFTAHRNECGLDYYGEACRKGWEGVIAKRADSVYRSSRSRDWLKFKCVNQQEFVIGGYTDPEGARNGFGALLLGYYEQGDFRCAGRVGTGFDEPMLEDLHARLLKRRRDSSPFDDGTSVEREAIHWVTPDLVCEIGFTEWTRGGRLRHPRFLGLREDKSASEVRRERPD